MRIKILNLFLRSMGFFKFPYQKITNKWFSDKGDETLRVDYDLGKNSIVFDIGGYKGNWASDIFSRYGCKIYIFEPVKEFADGIKRRFSKNKKIKVHNFGLADKTSIGVIYINDDKSSVFKGEGNREEISLIKALDFIKNNKIKKIDLMKINIEGGEYGLLEDLIKSGFVKKIENIQVQFHKIGRDYEKRMIDIQKKLKETHHLTYRYPFVWENWELNRMTD